MSEPDLEKLLHFFQVLANESRLKIVGILANRPCSVSELADLLDLKEPTVSHHLSELKSLDLVDMRVNGTIHIYSLNQKALVQISKDIFASEKIAGLVKNVDEKSWEEKVLSTFVVNGQLTQIPVQYKKQMVILRWLADKFEFERRYPEKEVNEIIRQYHPDYASLRRYMIDHRLMARESGIYWRLPVEASPAQRSRVLNVVECST